MTFILGSDDHEMRAIEALLTRMDQPFCYATGAVTGKRVRPGESAYGIVLRDGRTFDARSEDWSNATMEIGEHVAIEVQGPWGPPQINHHGDHERAHWGPENFLAASSIGQVVAMLARHHVLPETFEPAWGRAPTGPDAQFCFARGSWNVMAFQGAGGWRTVPTDIVHTAAADHCLAAAFRGQCPGVRPEEGGPFWTQAVRQSHESQGGSTTLHEFMNMLTRTQGTLRLRQGSAPGSTLALDLDPAGRVIDLTDLEVDGTPAPTGETFPACFQVGNLAGCILGLGYLVRVRQRDGTMGLRLGGCGVGTRPGREPVDRWLAGVGVARGCYDTQHAKPHNLYGDPVRGFGGGTIRGSSITL